MSDPGSNPSLTIPKTALGTLREAIAGVPVIKPASHNASPLSAARKLAAIAGLAAALSASPALAPQNSAYAAPQDPIKSVAQTAKATPQHQARVQPQRGKEKAVMRAQLPIVDVTGLAHAARIQAEAVSGMPRRDVSSAIMVTFLADPGKMVTPTAEVQPANLADPKLSKDSNVCRINAPINSPPPEAWFKMISYQDKIEPGAFIGGTARTWHQIVLLHEAAHCSLSGDPKRSTTTLLNEETTADLAAIRVFLRVTPAQEQGTAIETSATFLRARAIAALEIANPRGYRVHGGESHSTASSIHRGSVHGLTGLDVTREVYGVRDARAAFARVVEDPSGRIGNLSAAGKIKAATKAASDPKLSPEAKQVLQLYTEAMAATFPEAARAAGITPPTHDRSLKLVLREVDRARGAAPDISPRPPLRPSTLLAGR